MTSCIYLRQELPHLKQTCQTCTGHVEMKVFGCAQHGNCTFRATGTLLASCDNCDKGGRLTPGALLSGRHEVRA